MAGDAKPYTRLTRNAAGLGSYSSLWLGADHLMIVNSTGYTENYARVQLRDIKGVFVTASERRKWLSLAPAIVAILCLAIILFDRSRTGLPWGSIIFFSLSAALLGLNFALGPTCRVHVVTNVQTVPLPALVRRRKARRVLDRLQPLIAAAQADLVGAPPAPPPGPPPVTPPSPPSVTPAA